MYPNSNHSQFPVLCKARLTPLKIEWFLTLLIRHTKDPIVLKSLVSGVQKFA